MQISAWESYYPTLMHWLATGGGIILSMLLLNRLLQMLGVGREAATGYALILPWILGFVIWSAYPFARSLYPSFTMYNIFQPPEWVGLEHYVDMFTKNRDFWPAMRLTLLYAALNVPLGLAGAMGVALLLSRDVRGIGVWRTIYYLPAVLPSVALALLWRWMLSPRSGLINAVLNQRDVAAPQAAGADRLWNPGHHLGLLGALPGHRRDALCSVGRAGRRVVFWQQYGGRAHVRPGDRALF